MTALKFHHPVFWFCFIFLSCHLVRFRKDSHWRLLLASQAQTSTGSLGDTFLKQIMGGFIQNIHISAFFSHQTVET